MSTAHAPNPNYRPDIDGLRAVAVLAVLAYHAFPEWMRGGFIGVDVFFVISGFLISRILFESLENGHFSFKDFYLRRIRRILPALLVVLVACYVLGWFVLLPEEYRQLGKHVAAGAGFISNFILWSEAGYFDNAADTKPLLHLWSLGIEEQFYIVWPFLLWLAWRIKIGLIAPTLALLAISFYLNLTGIRQDPVATFYSPQTRFWELMSGGVLAWMVLRLSSRSADSKTRTRGLLASVIKKLESVFLLRRVSDLLSLSGCLLLAYGFWRISKDAAFPGYWALLPVLGSLLLIAAGPGAWINRTILSSRLAVWFGLISFPLYLWHWPLLSLARVVEEQTPAAHIRLAIVVISVGLAWLTYRLIERPIGAARTSSAATPCTSAPMHHHRLRLALPSILMGLLFATALVGLFTEKNDGLPWRTKHLNGIADLFDLKKLQMNVHGCGKDAAALSASLGAGGCMLSRDEEPSIVFIGDSHTGHYKHAIWAAFHEDAVMAVTEADCLPFATERLSTPACKSKRESLLTYLESKRSIQTVVLSGYWSYLIAGSATDYKDQWRRVGTPTPKEIESFKATATAMLSRIVGTGKQVIFLQDIPDLNFNIRKCFDYRPVRISQLQLIEGCALDENEYQARIAVFERTLAEVLEPFPSVRVFETKKYFCREGRCLAADASKPYYFNGDHLNAHGAKLVIDGLVREVFRPQ